MNADLISSDVACRTWYECVVVKCRCEGGGCGVDLHASQPPRSVCTVHNVVLPGTVRYIVQYDSDTYGLRYYCPVDR